MKNISLKKIQKTIEQNKIRLVKIEEEIKKICQIQAKTEKKEKEIEEKLSSMNSEIKEIFSYYDDIPFSLKIDLLTSTHIKKHLWNDFAKTKADSFYYEIKSYRIKYSRIKKQFDSIKQEEGKQAKKLIKLYDQKDIIAENIEKLELALFDELNENEIKILELF